MNIQARIDYLTEMLESAKYEASVNNNSVEISLQYKEITNDLENMIATLEYIEKLKQVGY